MTEIVDVAVVQQQEKNKEHRGIDKHSFVHGILLSGDW